MRLQLLEWLGGSGGVVVMGGYLEEDTCSKRRSGGPLQPLYAVMH